MLINIPVLTNPITNGDTKFNNNRCSCYICFVLTSKNKSNIFFLVEKLRVGGGETIEFITIDFSSGKYTEKLICAITFLYFTRMG